MKLFALTRRPPLETSFSGWSSKVSTNDISAMDPIKKSHDLPHRQLIFNRKRDSFIISDVKNSLQTLQITSSGITNIANVIPLLKRTAEVDSQVPDQMDINSTSNNNSLHYSANANQVAPMQLTPPTILATCTVASTTSTRTFSYCTTPLGGVEWYP